MERKRKLNFCITVVTVYQGFVTAMSHLLVSSCLFLHCKKQLSFQRKLSFPGFSWCLLSPKLPSLWPRKPQVSFLLTVSYYGIFLLDFVEQFSFLCFNFSFLKALLFISLFFIDYKMKIHYSVLAN